MRNVRLKTRSARLELDISHQAHTLGEIAKNKNLEIVFGNFLKRKGATFVRRPTYR